MARPIADKSTRGAINFLKDAGFEVWGNMLGRYWVFYPWESYLGYLSCDSLRVLAQDWKEVCLPPTDDDWEKARRAVADGKEES